MNKIMMSKKASKQIGKEVQNKSNFVEVKVDFYWDNRAAERNVSREKNRRLRVQMRYGSRGTETERTKEDIGNHEKAQNKSKRNPKHVSLQRGLYPKSFEGPIRLKASEKPKPTQKA